MPKAYDSSDEETSPRPSRKSRSRKSKKEKPLRTQAAAAPFQVIDKLNFDTYFSPVLFAKLFAGFILIWPIVGFGLCTAIFWGLLPATTLRFFGYE